MDAVALFAAEADAFEQWARQGRDHGEAAARTALVRITRLYLAGLGLPGDGGTMVDCPESERVDEAEWRAVFDHCARLPLDLYGEILVPTVLPPDEPVVGSLADDIADIYRDVTSGLRAYRAGRRAEALAAWRFAFLHHWGAHATGAIRALHCWLSVGAGVSPSVGP